MQTSASLRAYATAGSTETPGVDRIEPIEVMGREAIPAVAELRPSRVA